MFVLIFNWSKMYMFVFSFVPPWLLNFHVGFFATYFFATFFPIFFCFSVFFRFFPNFSHCCKFGIAEIAVKNYVEKVFWPKNFVGKLCFSCQLHLISRLVLVDLRQNCHILGVFFLEKIDLGSFSRSISWWSWFFLVLAISCFFQR